MGKAQVFYPGTPGDLVPHIGDMVRHITAAERSRWNNKAEVSPISYGTTINFSMSETFASSGERDSTKTLNISISNLVGFVVKGNCRWNINSTGSNGTPSIEFRIFGVNCRADQSSTVVTNSGSFNFSFFVTRGPTTQRIQGSQEIVCEFRVGNLYSSALASSGGILGTIVMYISSTNTTVCTNSMSVSGALVPVYLNI